MSDHEDNMMNYDRYMNSFSTMNTIQFFSDLLMSGVHETQKVMIINLMCTGEMDIDSFTDEAAKFCFHCGQPQMKTFVINEYIMSKGSPELMDLVDLRDLDVNKVCYQAVNATEDWRREKLLSFLERLTQAGNEDNLNRLYFCYLTMCQFGGEPSDCLSHDVLNLVKSSPNFHPSHFDKIRFVRRALGGRSLKIPKNIASFRIDSGTKNEVTYKEGYIYGPDGARMRQESFEGENRDLLFYYCDLYDSLMIPDFNSFSVTYKDGTTLSYP